jgi:uroporphyrinogen-III synthase
MPPAPDLHGRTIGVAADRRGEDQAVMFGRLGAEVILGPTMATVKVPDPGLLRTRTEQVIAAPPDFVIANTGIGVRTWMAAAAEWGLDGDLKEALARSRVVSRGPKATGGLASAGLTPWWRCPTEQLADVAEHLRRSGLQDKRVAFQLHGDDGSEFVARMEAAGASVMTVPVYLWQSPPDPAPARHLIDRTAAGGVDAVTFTAGPQVHYMMELARSAGMADRLLEAFNGGEVVAGCIGPVCAAAAETAGIRTVITPDHWRLGSLVKAVAEALSSPRAGSGQSRPGSSSPRSP